jgi:hypothetical protein
MIKLSDTLFLDRDSIQGLEIDNTINTYRLYVYREGARFAFLQGSLEELTAHLNKIIEAIHAHDSGWA